MDSHLVPQERIRQGENKTMGGAWPIVKGIEKDIDVGPIMDPMINKGKPTSIVVNNRTVVIGVENQDQTVTREVLLCLYFAL